LENASRNAFQLIAGINRFDERVKLAVANELFWFPPEDKDLIGSHSTRDPLGFLPIWSQRGRAIIRNLTEQTWEAEGFQLLASTFRWIEDFQVSYPSTGISAAQFFLLVEQAFAFSTHYLTREWPLPGKNRVRIYVAEDCRLSLKRGILANQLAYGVWGLYRGAAFRSGMLHDSLTCLSARFVDDIGNGARLSPKAKRQLFKFILRTMEDKDKQAVFPLHGGRKLVSELSAIIKNLPNKKLLLRYLIPKESPEERIASMLFMNKESFNKIAGFRRTFIELAMRDLPEEREALENIRRCEDFIAPAEAIFHYLFHFAGKTVKEAVAGIKIEMDKMKDAFSLFRGSGEYTGGTAARFAIYRDGIDFSSATSFITSLIDCHLKVASGRRREPWLVIESNKIRAFTQFDPPNELDAMPGKTWRNDYYLGPLLSIYSRLRR